MVVRNSLKAREIPIFQSGFDQIDTVGFDGERIGTALLTMALNGRVSWGSRKEDNSKIDLIVTFQNPNWHNEVEVVLAQVKTGQSYGSVEKQKITIGASATKDFIGRHHNTLLCWADTQTQEIYWILIRSETATVRSQFNISHRLTPCSRYDIVRVLNSFRKKDGGSGLVFSARARYVDKRKYTVTEFRDLRTRAKLFYKQLSKSTIVSPVFDQIEFTRLGWRHLTRESRLNDYKVAAFEIMPILRHIVEKAPSNHRIQKITEESNKNMLYRQVDFILEYDKIKLNFNDIDMPLRETRVFVKLREVVRYPKDWKTCMHLSQSIDRRLIFRSVYYKHKTSRKSQLVTAF